MKNIDIEELKNKEIFKVPENYFDNLTDRLMSQIPAENTKIISINQSKKHSSNWWKWSSAAACVVVLVAGTTFLAKNSKSSETEEETTTPELAASYDEKSQEEMIEYSMLDTEDVYCYLSGESY